MYNPNSTLYRIPAPGALLRNTPKPFDLPLIERDDYGRGPLSAVGRHEHRCVKCYEMRLFEAARAGKEGGFDSFTPPVHQSLQNMS